MHHPNVTSKNPLGDKQKFYDDLISGCVEHYNQEKKGFGKRCLDNEKDRVEMSLRQPKGMYNYVSTELDATIVADSSEQIMRHCDMAEGTSHIASSYRPN
jgi:hypothetical protein